LIYPRIGEHLSIQAIIAEFSSQRASNAGSKPFRRRAGRTQADSQLSRQLITGDPASPIADLWNSSVFSPGTRFH
jgi:hypothetical protein